jgi:hypothetical protein
MELLFSYNQEKKDRSDLYSSCNLKLFSTENYEVIRYQSTFYSEYLKHGTKRTLTFDHSLDVNLTSGDFFIHYKLNNEGRISRPLLKNTLKNNKNNFKSLDDLLVNGYFRGEKKVNYWGVKYNRAINRIYHIIFEVLSKKFKNEYYKDKEYSGLNLDDKLYQLIVDFHLDCKGIKSHDNIYEDIKNDYPKKKYLVKNDHKFLPAILEEYGIKSKYLIGELNKSSEMGVKLKSLKYICHLFGENYIDYLKKFPWKNITYGDVPNKKLHILKNENEKIHLTKLLNKWNDVDSVQGTAVNALNKLLSIREFLEKYNFDLKFKIKNTEELNSIYEVWNGYKTHLNRGYRLKYVIDESFKKHIEEDILIDSEIYKPKLILNEEDFIFEGQVMKNCMSKQFSAGVIYLFVSLQNRSKRINLQYKKGFLIQSYGKANTEVPSIFNGAVEILTNRFKMMSNITWKKEKYDIIQKVK